MSEFKRRSYSEKDKKKWEKVLIPEFMSSDESGTEDGKGVIFVKKIPWRSPKVETFFQNWMIITVRRNLSKPPGKQSRE